MRSKSLEDSSDFLPWITILCFFHFFSENFHSMKNMHYPLRAAGVSLISKLALSLLLMPQYQVFGLAWANVISALIQTIYLWIRLKKMDIKDTTKTPTYHIFIILFSVGLMSLLLFFAENLHDSHASKLDCIIYLCIAIPYSCNNLLPIDVIFGLS